MKYFLSLVFIFFTLTLTAQSVADSLLKQDSPVVAVPLPVKKKIPPKPIPQVPEADSLKQVMKPAVVATSIISQDDRSKYKASYAEILRLNPYFSFYGKATSQTIQKRDVSGKEGIFYLLSGLLLFFAFVKLFFNKYLQNLLSVFFRISLKQKQMREQLLQAPLPSLLLNGFFIVTASIYLTFLLKLYKVHVTDNFWWVLFYCLVGLLVIYLIKFLALKFAGWVFNMREASSTYIFIVFLINKLLGIFLMPLLILMAFSDSGMFTVWLTLSYIIVFFAFAYRYISAFGPIRREINVNPLHFFVYLCAFEIIPLILIYKVLLNFLERTV